MLSWKLNVIFLMTGGPGYYLHTGAPGSWERIDSLTSGLI